MTEKYTRNEICRCCGNDKLVPYLDLKKQPLANDYHKKTEHIEKYELKVNVCTKCFHSQLSITVDPAIMFRHYLYVSGTTKTFNTHCEEFAKHITKLHGGTNLKVNDIACNDGTLLEKFRNEGCSVFGVDPAANLRQYSEEKNIDVIVDFWSEDLSKTITEKYDIITGTNVFAHVDNIYGFLRGCKNILNTNGIVTLEFPYGQDFIKKFEFDTVYHEHLSYFTVRSFKALTDRLGFKIVDVTRTPIHGGSIRMSISLDREEINIDSYINAERENGIYDLDTYLEYQNVVDDTKRSFESYCRGKKVIGYAASAKGNTALNYFNATDVEYIVDDNPLKHNHFTPGCDIKIIDTKTGLDVDEDLFIVVLAWNFKEEIKKRVKAVRGDRKTTMIYYVPEFYTEEI